jgi:DNA end-binding protein Ku
MASRPIWRGHLRLALVSCPVALYNARHDRAAIRFNQINPATGNRIKMITQDGETGQELERGKLVKGYEFAKSKYLILNDEDFDSVKVESSSVMAVEKFVDATSIDPMYYDACYFLAPDGKAGEDVYAVLREAIIKTNKVALTRVVISQRERTVALHPMGVGLMAHTLYEDRDLNSSKEFFGDAAELKVDPEMIDLAMQLIKRQSGKYDPADLEDRYETRLRAMIDAKLQGGGLITEPDTPKPRESNVIDLVAALKTSLAGASQDEPTARAKKIPAKAALAKPVPPPATTGSRQATSLGSVATTIRTPRRRA